MHALRSWKAIAALVGGLGFALLSLLLALLWVENRRLVDQLNASELKLYRIEARRPQFVLLGTSYAGSCLNDSCPIGASFRNTGAPGRGKARLSVVGDAGPLADCTSVIPLTDRNEIGFAGCTASGPLLADQIRAGRPSGRTAQVIETLPP
jgi:hypothetical protein